MHQRLLTMPILGRQQRNLFIDRGSFLFSQRSVPDGKENKMKVVIRYETERVTFNLSDEEARQMGCCVNIDLESIPEDERQSKLQEACDEQFNRPDLLFVTLPTPNYR